MLWTLRFGPAEPAPPAEAPPDGRYVIQRHLDDAGPHLDVRLEQPEGYLLGWRVDATTLDGEACASEKAPHPLDWLDHDGDARREEAGTYRWLDRDEHGGRLFLTNAQGARTVTVERGQPVSAAAVRAIQLAASRLNVRLEDAARLIEDGAAARDRAIDRCCGLGRELDGDAFDEAHWRAAFRAMPLHALHAHQRALELRFDAKYPPLPASRPVPLDGPVHAPGGALALLRD